MPTVSVPPRPTRHADLVLAVREAFVKAKGTNARRQALLFRHPDLTARLLRPPLGYQEPRQWSGYLPPERWREQPNDSPRRAVLVEMLTEARRREAARAGASP